MSCQGICSTLSSTRKSRARKKDFKKCVVCNIAIKTKKIRCPCCQHILRIKVR